MRRHVAAMLTIALPGTGSRANKTRPVVIFCQLGIHLLGFIIHSLPRGRAPIATNASSIMLSGESLTGRRGAAALSRLRQQCQGTRGGTRVPTR